jgi:hypothetical protein
VVFLESPNEELPSEEVFAAPVSDTEPPAFLLPPITLPPPVEISSEDIERIQMRMLAAIADEFRTSIDADISRLFSIRAALEQQEDERERYFRDPTWPTISALPGVSGFQIQKCPESRCLSDLLADEPDEPAWSRAMESRIIGELAKHTEAGLSQIFVVCRQETCGILLPLSESAPNRPNVMLAGSEILSDLGFAHYSFAERPDFQAIYVTNRENAPEMWSQ